MDYGDLRFETNHNYVFGEENCAQEIINKTSTLLNRK